MRVLIIDDSEDFRVLAAQLLSIEWPDIHIDEHDPAAQGPLPSDLNLPGYDAVLLDYCLGPHDGLEWLKALKRRRDCPAILFVTENGNEDVAVKAIKFGAHEYLRKHDLDRQRIAMALRSAIAEQREAAREERSERTIPLAAAEIEAGGPATMTALAATVDVSQRPEDIKIGGYRITQAIGRGGMAHVYLAQRVKDQLQVVLKVLDGKFVESEQFLQRFVQEYATAERINSPYVVRIYDQGFTDKHVFIAMEYFPMGDLKKYMRGLSTEAAFKIFYHTAKALVVVHEAGVLHRDLKPQNIMFRADGSLALVDFGIAKMLDQTNPLTTNGEIYGTPYYMSPEQVTGAKIDPRSDLYSAGVILYEMLTGAKPFTAASAPLIAEQHVRAPIPRLPAAVAQYQSLVDKLLAKQPQNRFQSAKELLAELAFAMKSPRIN